MGISVGVAHPSQNISSVGVAHPTGTVTTGHAPTYYPTTTAPGAVASWTTTAPPPAPTSTSGGGAATGGGGGANTALDAASIANTNKTLAELPGLLARGLAANNQEFQNAQQGFNAQEQQQRGTYDKSTTTNQQNYDANLMAALRSGAQGLSGLLSILRGTGAENWANNVVRDTTNTDIRTGANTHDQNQTSLDSSLSSFLTDLATKRHQNDLAHQSNEFAARKDNATQMQDLYMKMAQYYADMGDNGNATAFLNKAGDLSHQIAQYDTAPVAKYDTTPIAVAAPQISAFAGPSEQKVTATPNDNAGPSAGIFTIGDTRRRLAGAGA